MRSVVWDSTVFLSDVVPQGRTMCSQKKHPLARRVVEQVLLAVILVVLPFWLLKPFIVQRAVVNVFFTQLQLRRNGGM